MDTSQDHRRKSATEGSAGPARSTNVFDRLGNEALRAQVESLGEGPEEQSPPSLLAEAEASEAAKSGPGLGEDGRALVHEEMKRSAAELRAIAPGLTAEDAVIERLEKRLPEKEISDARAEGRLDLLVRRALHGNAIDARDEIVFLLQQVMGNEVELRRIAGGPGGVGIGLVEHLADNLVDQADLASLAAYDHADLQQRVLVGPEAMSIKPSLSLYALRMGGFATVLFQMVQDDLRERPLPEAGPTAGAAEADPQLGQQRAEALRASVFRLIAQLRMFRTESSA